MGLAWTITCVLLSIVTFDFTRLFIQKMISQINIIIYPIFSEQAYSNVKFGSYISFLHIEDDCLNFKLLFCRRETLLVIIDRNSL